MQALQWDLKQVEESHGNEVFTLVLARGYPAKLFGNTRFVPYLTQHHSDVLRELQSICDATMQDAASTPKSTS
jgi:thymidine kinase